MRIPSPIVAFLRRFAPFLASAIILLIIGYAVIGDREPGQTALPPRSDAEIEYLRNVDSPWSKRDFLNKEGVMNLPPAGNLPSLQEAMRTNAPLRQKVNEFQQRDDAYLFANYQQADADITTILLLWGGADINDTGQSAEGMDNRVERFLRGIYAETASVTNNPIMGKNPWPRLFLHYKLRLLAQTAGGQAPFDGTLRYDAVRDRIFLDGQLSSGFFRDFGAFLNNQNNPRPFRNNLVYYIDKIRPLSGLSEDEQQAVDFIR